MAKGDKSRHQKQIDTQNTQFQTGMTGLNNTLQGSQNTFMNNYNTGVGKNMGSYDEIMQGYRGIVDDPTMGGKWGRNPGAGFTPGTYTPQEYTYSDPFKSYGGYEEFSKTGGLSADDQSNMRARGIAPTRAIYQNALRGINRQKALQGGYSPNATAALAKNKRDMTQQITDANIGVNSDIAKMVQSGKLAGLGGMSDIEKQRLGAEIGKNKYAADSRMWSEEMTGADRRYGAGLEAQYYRDPGDQVLQALGGMTNLYGATPGMAATFGNQVLQNQGQLGQAQEMQGNWGQNQIQNQYQNSQIPSNFDTTMGRIGKGIGMAGQIGAAIGTGGASLALPGGGMYGPGSFRGGQPNVGNMTGTGAPYNTLFQPGQAFQNATGYGAAPANRSMAGMYRF